MKRLMIIFSVCIFLLSGCKTTDEQLSSSVMESVEMETSAEEETVKEEQLEAEVEMIQPEVTKEGTSDMSSDKAEHTDTESAVETVTSETTKSEVEDITEETKESVEIKETEGKEDAIEEAAFVSYSPQSVVSLATSKTKAYGKITLTDNLDALLAYGTITQEEYDAYYPYDGAGYYSVFIETDLSKASTTSGRLLKSEEQIAQYIADMLASESGSYFLIEYAGIYSKNGTDFYEFRCYRA